jgi:hypothetical protein
VCAGVGEHPLVRQAFRHYLIAAAATDAGSTNGGNRAEHILSANVAAVLQEALHLTTQPFKSEQLSWIYKGVLPPAWLKRNHIA